MHKTYNNKLNQLRLNPRLILVRSSIHMNANFVLIRRSKPIT